MDLGFQKGELEGEIVKEDDYSLTNKLVPWLSWNEWDFVRENLFSSSSDSITVALERITAWRSRGCLPIPIEVTASIIESQQKDPFFRNDSKEDELNSEEILSMLYSMSIIRFVNGMIEKNRKKPKTSISDAAYIIGIPRMLIDIRHESSHRVLPSLKVLRLASVKALDWLVSYYWEPQKNSIPMRDGIVNVRKEINSKLRELAFHLGAKQASQTDSSSKKAKRIKQPELLSGSNKFFSRMAVKIKESKSGGSKKQVKRTLNTLVQLYSSYPSEVVASLLEFLLKGLSSSDGNGVESFDVSVLESNPSLKILTGTTTIWKQMVTRFLTKEPELLLTLLKATLEMIDSREASADKTGTDQLSSSLCSAQVRQIEYLYSLVPWLIGNLNTKKKPSKTETGSDIQDHVPKVVLVELLKKCLLVSSPGNTEIADSAVLLAQMLGNNNVVKRLEKLSQLSPPDMVDEKEGSSHSAIDKFLFEQERAVNQAADKLEFLKQRRFKGITLNKTAEEGKKKKKETTWKVAELWNPCPIGMLPRIVGTTGVIPVLDRAAKTPEIEHSASEDDGTGDLNKSSRKRNASYDVEFTKNATVSKKTKVVKTSEADNQQYPSVVDMTGYLMIGGAWEKVSQEEIHVIESAVRIFA